LSDGTIPVVAVSNETVVRLRTASGRVAGARKPRFMRDEPQPDNYQKQLCIR